MRHCHDGVLSITNVASISDAPGLNTRCSAVVSRAVVPPQGGLLNLQQLTSLVRLAQSVWPIPNFLQLCPVDNLCRLFDGALDVGLCLRQAGRLVSFALILD